MPAVQNMRCANVSNCPTVLKASSKAPFLSADYPVRQLSSLPMSWLSPKPTKFLSAPWRSSRLPLRQNVSTSASTTVSWIRLVSPSDRKTDCCFSIVTPTTIASSAAIPRCRPSRLASSSAGSPARWSTATITSASMSVRQLLGICWPIPTSR